MYTISSTQSTGDRPLLTAPLTYTLYARPLNVRRGNKVRVYLREFLPDPNDRARSRGRSSYIDTAVDATLPSAELRNEWADHAAMLLGGIAPEGTRFDEHPFDEQHKVLHAALADRSKEQRELINDLAKTAGVRGLFRPTQYSGSQDMRFKFPPFTTPSDLQRYPDRPGEGFVSEQHIEHDLKMMLAATMDDVHMYFDMETENWDKPGLPEEFSMIVAGTNKPWLKKVLFTRYDPGVREDIGEVIKEVDGYTIKIFKDHEDLCRKLLAYIRYCDPLSIDGFNIASYDLLKGRELLPAFIAGVDGTEPKVLSASGRYKSTQVHGRCVIDVYNKLQPEYPFLVNQRLGALMRHLRHEFKRPLHFEKSLNYTQLSKAFADAAAGDKQGLRDALKYTAADGDADAELLGSQLEEILLQAILLHRRPESICKGFAGAADERWKREYFALRNTMLDRHKYGYTPRMKPHEDQRQFFFQESGHDTARRGQDGKVLMPRKEGAFQHAVFFYPTLYLNAAQDLIASSHKLRALAQHFEGHQPSKEYRGARRLQEILVLPVTEYLDSCRLFGLAPTMRMPERVLPHQPESWKDRGKTTTFEEKDREFADAFGAGRVGLRAFNGRFAEEVALWRKVFDPSELIANDSQFLIVEESLAFALTEERLGIALAYGPAISFGRRAFLYSQEQGTLYVMRSKLTPSANAEWERDLIQELLTQGLRHVGETGRLDRHALRESLEERLGCIGEVDRTKLLLQRKRRNTEMPMFGIEKEEDERALRSWYGFLDNREAQKEEFLSSGRPPSAIRYCAHFCKAYGDILDFLLGAQKAKVRPSGSRRR